jgi:hypothetical protein
VRPLTNVTDYPCVVPFHQKFEGTDAEGMPWAQTVAFLVKQSPIHTAWFPAVHVKISQDQGVIVESYLEMIIYYAVPVE